MNSKVFGVICIISVLLLVADFMFKRKTYVPIEALYGFYPLIALIICLAALLLASALHSLLARPNNYYAENSTEGEESPKKQKNGKVSDV